MTHIDEGTIHAWLDGQLDATRSRAVEAHVAGCAQCAAMVAEARGLVAGASRVLTALDDVPHGVIPLRPPAAAKPAKRRWQAARWVTGISAIAAALIVAVVLSDRPQRASRPDAPGPVVLPGATAQAPRVTQAPGASIAAPAPSGVVVATGAGSAAAASIGNAPRPSRASAGHVAAAPAPAAMMDQAAPAPPKVAAASAGAAATAEAAGPMRDADLAVSSARCYVVAETERTAAAREQAAVAPPLAARKASRVTSTPAAAAEPAVALLVLRLDSTSAPGGHPARAVPADTVVGTWEIAGDSARVRLRSGATVTVPLAKSVRCP